MNGMFQVNILLGTNLNFAVFLVAAIPSHCHSPMLSRVSRHRMSLSRSNSLRLLSFHVQRTQLHTTLVLAHLGGFTVNCELFQNYRSNRAVWLGTYKDWNSI